MINWKILSIHPIVFYYFFSRLSFACIDETYKTERSQETSLKNRRVNRTTIVFTRSGVHPCNGGTKVEINTPVAVFEEMIIHRIIHLNRNVISMLIFIGFALQRRPPVVNFKYLLLRLPPLEFKTSE